MRALAAAIIYLTMFGGVCGLELAHAEPMDLELRTRDLLSQGVEESVTPQALAKLGPALPDALIAIFERTSEARYVRLRALSVLSQRPEPRVTQHFARLLREGVEVRKTLASDAMHPSRSPLVLRRTIEALTSRRQPKLQGDLTRALVHANAHVRHAAVLALQRLKSAGVERALAAQLARETSPFVIAALTNRSVRSKAPRPIAPKSVTPPR